MVGFDRRLTAVPIQRSCKPSDQLLEEPFETFYPHASPTHTATGARLQNQQAPTVYRRANLTIYPSSSEASDWLLVTKGSLIFHRTGDVGILGSGVSVWPDDDGDRVPARQAVPRQSRSGHLAMACRRAPR